MTSFFYSSLCWTMHNLPWVSFVHIAPWLLVLINLKLFLWAYHNISGFYQVFYDDSYKKMCWMLWSLIIMRCETQISYKSTERCFECLRTAVSNFLEPQARKIQFKSEVGWYSSIATTSTVAFLCHLFPLSSSCWTGPHWPQCRWGNGQNLLIPTLPKPPRSTGQI